MQSSILITAFLPIAVAIVMFGLGLSLAISDFTRVARQPKAAAIALMCQIVVLPSICLGLVLLLNLDPPLAVGAMLLAASPGGTSANLFSHLAGGDVALNIALTAINSVLAVVTMPVVVNLALAGFMGSDDNIGLQPGKMGQIVVIVLVPVAVGMAVHRRFPGFAERMRGPVRIASVGVLVTVIAVAIFQERGNVGEYLKQVGIFAAVLSVTGITLGYAIPRLASINKRQATASAFEVGIHNAALAIAIALSPSLLNDSRMAIPAAVYGVVMFFPAGAFCYYLARETRASSQIGVSTSDTLPSERNTR
jgi:BASS family bile acid:Na+ symporter